MNNIQVFSDNAYTQLAFRDVVRKLTTSVAGDKSLAIFMFEKSWVCKEDMLNLMRSSASDILVLCSLELHGFIQSMTMDKHLMFGRYDADMKEINVTIKRYLNSASKPAAPVKWGKSRAISLTQPEQQTMELILQGQPVCSISKIVQRDYKTVSTHKRSVMRKLGTSSDAGLIMRGKMYMLMNTVSMLAG